MNYKIEIQKIKVNNGQELIAKAKKYKNSGGEWKLREKYWVSAGGQGGRNTNEKHAVWGIIIANGSQEVEIFSTKIRDEEGGGKGVLVNRLDEVESRPELHQLFPESQPALFSSKKGDKIEKLDYNTYKPIKEVDGEYDLVRYLVAENFHHLKQIIRDYCKENETKICNSASCNFSDWVEIIDGRDGNVYLYVGKNGNGGREIKIGIEKVEFENKNAPVKGSDRSQLEVYWILFLMSSDRSLTPTEQKKYYSNGGGLEEHWQTVERYWEQACRTTLEALREQLMKARNYWDNEPSEQTRNREIIKVDAKIGKINRRLEEIKNNYPDWYNNYDKICSDCGDRMCCFHRKGCERGNQNNHYKSKNHLDYLLLNDFQGDNHQAPNSPHPTLKSSQISETDKNQLLQLFLTYNIAEIREENGELKIKYKETTKAAQKVNISELQKYQAIIQNQPNHSLSLEDLQKIDTNSTPNQPNNNKLVLGLVFGTGIVVLGTIAYLVRKRKKKF